MRPVAGFSKVLSSVLVPLLAWGMISALVLQLIDLRSLFVGGGEGKLRFAVLAFSLGVVLIQRLTAEQGQEVAGGYRWGLGGAMTLFNLYFSLAFRTPLHPMIMFVANGVIFVALWWIGMRITAACAVDSDDVAAVASETGILRRFSRMRGAAPKAEPAPSKKNKPKKLTAEEEEKQWRDRLPPQHPGRILFFFALFALPAFGLGALMFPPGNSMLHLGINLFIFLWCAVQLLALSSMRQLDAYLGKRGVALPDFIGLTWLAAAFLLGSIVVAAAFLLPQPHSEPSDFVRERIVATYAGMESRFGIADTSPGRQPGGTDGNSPAKTDKNATDRNAPAKSAEQRELDKSMEKAYYREKESRLTATQRALRKAFDFLLKGIAVIALLSFVAVIIVLVMAMWSGFSGPLQRLRALREKKSAAKKNVRKKPSGKPAPLSTRFADPFIGAAPIEGDSLVEYLWDATLAACAERGHPCPDDQTPAEFLASDPDPIAQLKPQASRLVHWLMHVRFSNQPLPASALPELREFWNALSAAA